MAFKLRKLQKSNDMHTRLGNKHVNDFTVTGTAKWHYHNIVKITQMKRGKILPLNERRKIFAKVLAGTKKGEFK